METLYPASYMSNSNWFLDQESFEDSYNQSTNWTKEENKRFESLLAIYSESTPDRWLKVAAMIPGKTVFDVIKQYRELEEDVSDIEAGKVPVPGYDLNSSFAFEFVSERDLDSRRKKPLVSKNNSDQEKKKGVPWTEEEHRRFLMGLIKYGKGDWRNISRNFVITKTPTQVASHAQKYYIRQLSGGKDKRRPSIHDITTVNLAEEHKNSDEQSIVIPQKYSVGGRGGGLDWDESDDGDLMVFNSGHGNLFIPSSAAYEIGSNGIKLHGQNVYGTAYHGTHIKTQNSVF